MRKRFWIVTCEHAAKAAGKGAAVGAASGGTIGGVKGYSSNDARREIVDDLNDKSLENKSVKPNSIAHGFIFFPGEAKSAKRLRIQLIETDTNTVHTLLLNI